MAEPGGLLERLEARAAPSVAEPKRGTNYNFPLAYYRRTDGRIVQLQSDPQNRTYYEDKGFVMLRPPEVREWLQEVRPSVLREQKRRAQLITGIRKIESRAPQYIIDQELQVQFASMTVEELEEEYRAAQEATGLKIRLPSIKPEKDQPAHDARMRGVETSETTSMEEVQARMERSAVTVQGQGHDPIREARRR